MGQEQIPVRNNFKLSLVLSSLELRHFAKLESLVPYVKQWPEHGRIKTWRDRVWGTLAVRVCALPGCMSYSHLQLTLGSVGILSLTMFRKNLD